MDSRKSTTFYEVWVGDDLVDDCLSFETASKIIVAELKQGHGAEIVLDEITHHTIRNIDDLEDLGV